MKHTLKMAAVALMSVTMLSACMMPAHNHNKPATTPRADYSARCMGNSYDGCYETAKEQCRGTAGYSVFAKKNNVIGKEIMYSCILK